MDIVGSLGYVGQDLFFQAHDRFAFVCGQSISVFDPVKGPREIVWRTEDGISKIAVHSESQAMAIAPMVSGKNLEVVGINEPNLLYELENPTSTIIIDIAFSRQGDRIYALSDKIDQQIMVWKVTNSSARLLIACKLDKICDRLLVNPCSIDIVALSGDDGLVLTTINEILGTFSIKKFLVVLDQYGEEKEQQTGLATSRKSIKFMLWLPFNSLLVGDSDGNIYQVSADKKISTMIGRFMASSSTLPKGLRDSNEDKVVPTCGLLSMQHVIIGTEDGLLLWYPVSNPGQQLNAVELANPVQVANVGSRCVVSALAMDQNFQSVVVGTLAGSIFTAAVEVVESYNNHDDLAKLENENEGGVVAAPEVQSIERIPLEPISTDMHEGVVLCSRDLSMGVEKNSKGSKSSLSMFVTGAHTGYLCFWRQISLVVEPMVVGGGIRRSIPRSMKTLFRFPIESGGGFESDEGGGFARSAICCLEIMCVPNKNNAVLLCVGNVAGCVELWSMEAVENEDEDAKDSFEPDDIVRMLEDDEGGCLVRLECRRLFQMRLFTSPVAFMTPMSYRQQDISVLGIAIGSSASPRVFMVNLMAGDKVLLKKVVGFLSVDEGDLPAAAVWHAETIFVLCESGNMYTLTAQNFDDPESRSKTSTGLSTITSASFCSLAGTLIVVSRSNLLHSFPVEALALASVGEVSDNPSFRSLAHSDLAVTVALSPNGRYMATGCIDGSLFLWRFGEQSEMSLANRIHLHSSAVISITFSACSSLLLSVSVDGSSFVSTVDKASLTASKRMSTLGKGNLLQEKGPLQVAEPDPSGEDGAAQFSNDLSLTWLELHKLAEEQHTRAQHKFKAMGITAAVDEIAERLAILLEQNAERNELESLDRAEFVIDVPQRNVLAKKNEELVLSVRNAYEQRNSWNELRAARIRQKCWDGMEAQAITLLPCSSENAERAYGMSVTSYSVQRYSSAHLATFERVKRLRGIELRTQKMSHLGTVDRIPEEKTLYRCAWSTGLQGCPSNVSWIFNDGARWPSGDIVESILRNDQIQTQDATAGVPATAKEGQQEKKGEKDKAAQAAGFDEDDDMSVNSRDEDREIDETNLLNLLYPPQAVRTQIQKRTQIILLKEIIRQIRLQFNARFDVLFREKEDAISSIDSRNTRISAILEELRQKESLFAPKLSDLEVRGSSITVTAAELKNKPYESETARQQRLREEEEKRLRDLENDKEDIKGRALEEMMHGTLEVKRDVLAESAGLERPEWMAQLDPSEMNEAQLKEYDAYQQAAKALQEEQLTYRKTLEQEMKKLKHEIHDICKSFDDKLEELSKLKILVHREILSNELYISRLAHSMAKTDQTRKMLTKVEDEILTVRRDRNELRRKIEEFNSKLEEMKAKIGAVQEEERQMDKAFRRDLQNLCNNTFDQDSLKVFTKLYRLRSYPRGAIADNQGETYGDESGLEVSTSQNPRRSGTNSSNKYRHSYGAQSRRSHGGSKRNDATGKARAGGGKLRASRGVNASGSGVAGKESLGPMQLAAQALRSSEETSYLDKDPYYIAVLQQEKQKKALESQIPILNTLSMELDCPEGFAVDQFSWSKLQELRTSRIEKEIEGKQLSIEFSELKQKLELLDSEEAVLAGCMTECKASRDSLVAELRDLESNIDLIVCLRQGQDEVDKEAVVTDYSDALLLPIDVLNKYNSRIKELGKEKIGVLSRIKQFRRKINLIDWQAQHHGLEARHYEEYLTDLQLFRVTRELQRVLRDGSDASQVKEKVEKVTQRRDFLNNDYTAKLTNLKKNNENLTRLIEEKNQECIALEGRINALGSTVANSQNVLRSRDEARGTTGDPVSIAASKMKKIVSRRQMVDTARAQAEEIDFLRQELDRMRQRTFPSFVRATRKRIASNQDF